MILSAGTPVICGGHSRRFSHAIWPFTQNTTLYGDHFSAHWLAVFSRRSQRNVIEERLIHRGFQLIVTFRQTVNQCGICSPGRIGIPHLRARLRCQYSGIDDDHASNGFLTRLFKIVKSPHRHSFAFRGVITKQHYQFTVFDIRRAVTICPAAEV